MSTTNPCGYEACTSSFIVGGDAEERTRCFYPNAKWTSVEISQDLALPLHSRLGIHGTSIANVRILPSEGENIELRLYGRHPSPDGRAKLMMRATGCDGIDQPCNIVLCGPGYLCESFASDGLYLDVMIPEKHRFETIAITGRSVMIQMSLVSSKTIRISAKNSVDAKIKAPRLFVAAQGAVRLGITSIGNTSADIISTRGDIELALTGFTKFSANCSAVESNIDFESDPGTATAELRGSICAQTGIVTIK